MKYWCCCCLTWTQLSWDHSWRIGNVKFNINYSLILCRVSQHEPRHVLSYATYIFIPIQMTSPFCLHFIHVLFFEILLPVCRSSLLISYCLLKQLVMRICIYVLSDIFSPYFSLSGKMPSSIKTNIKSASGSMHPYNRWAPLFFFYSIIHHLFHFRDSPQETTFTTFVIFYMKPLFSWNCPTSTKLFLCSQSVSPTFLFSTSWSKTKSWNICQVTCFLFG